MRCRASRPGWRRRPRRCRADKVCCAPIGHHRGLFAVRPPRYPGAVDGSGRDACACARGSRCRKHGIDGATEAATFGGRVWPRCPFHRGLCRGRAEAPADCRRGSCRRARTRPPSPSSEICCDGGGSRSREPASQRPKSYAPPRRSPTKPIPTNCGAKDGRWCCDGFASTVGVGIVENALLGPI